MLLYLDCPCTSFPRSFARDYKETYRYPPPSTIYGLLLSLVGEVDRMAHVGVKLAIGVIGDDPPISRIVRKQRHHKFGVKHLGTYPTSQFSKPNHHELLTDLQVAIQIDSSEELAAAKLIDRVAIALSTPEQITRFGGLSLGESWALVNGARLYRETDGLIRWLVKDNRGLIALPVWIDRTTSQGTFQRFSLSDELIDDCLVSIVEPAPSIKMSKAKSVRKAKG
ncbi:MAG: type I-MYXAN CRISPR-associated protein Cas5/Cmx5/DevS [Leptolyngbya sp. UWPOB_LEPTO1]|uniref:type I-MYXAN CRISPR-associated protein Cas5/Cmx5/DevS n=1 Tax=Leptolyngbya sp. UWPOB_LEPTO1 TaxID=2815653 RepID=UPI001AD08656|nr:type I-MYXAN CRISPR-associated protein Cas5/Cmx5/DevS [Leptolyngbya sp. UWPOB_LEPTO1]MBN8564100.1 type I-MYXAN CRISPR-associated protein Cas5/Cmx5/DevS [Leptolyngbya sp. UWPOB_LEPTO1]